MGSGVSNNMVPLPSPVELTSKRRDGLFAFALLISAIGFLCLCGIYGPVNLRHWFAPVPFQKRADLALLLGAVSAAMVIHEVGHLVASMLFGFHLLGGSLGPLHVQVLPGTWKLSWSARTFFTGSVSSVPRRLNRWRGDMMAVIAAGPLATLLAGLAIAHVAASGHAGTFAQAAFVQVSVLLFCLGLIPNGRHAGRHNDARMLLDLFQRKEGAEEMELRVMVKHHMVTGKRPEDYDKALLVRLAGYRGRVESQVMFAQAIAQWAIDTERIPLASAWDSHSLLLALSGRCGKRTQNTALASSGCFDVIFRGNMQSARDKFARVDFDALFPTCFEQRARAARQVSLGQPKRAPWHIIRAQYSLPRGIEYYGFERMLLGMLHMLALSGETTQGKATSASA